MKKKTYKKLYEVQEFVQRKSQDGQWVYQVKWKDYDEAENTWEPLEHLENVLPMLNEFNAKLDSVDPQKLRNALLRRIKAFLDAGPADLYVEVEPEPGEI